MIGLEIQSSIPQAESIASHIMLMLIRSLGIREISKSTVTLEGLDKIDIQRLDAIVEKLASYNAGQMLALIEGEIDIESEADDQDANKY